MEVELWDALNDPENESDIMAEASIEIPILFAEEKGVPGPRIVWGLKHMITKAENTSVDWCNCCNENMLKQIARAKNVLVRLTAKVDKQQAKIKLKRAAQRDSIDDINECIEVALEQEVDTEDILAARERIVFLAERARASAELSFAMAGDDIVFLQWAISTAESAKADETFVEEAKVKLRELESTVRETEMFKIKKAAQLRAAVFRSGKLADKAVDEACDSLLAGGFNMKVVSPSKKAKQAASIPDPAASLLQMPKFSEDEGWRIRQPFMAPFPNTQSGPGSVEAKMHASNDLQRAFHEGAVKPMQNAVRAGTQVGLPPSELAGAHRSQRLVSAQAVRGELAALRKGMAKLEASAMTMPKQGHASQASDKTRRGYDASATRMNNAFPFEDTGDESLRLDRTVDPQEALDITQMPGTSKSAHRSCSLM